MGFPEARKTAKDINTNTNKCSAQLEELLSSLNEKLNLMNSLISSISGGYVSKDYVDSRIERVEYQGKGSFGIDNPTILEFDVMPRYVELICYRHINGGAVNVVTTISFPYTIVDTALLTEEYTLGLGFTASNNVIPHGKRVGNSIYWYVGDNASPSKQCNDENYIYYFRAIY